MRTARCTLNDTIMLANARIWHEAGGGPLRPVLKSDGYGWGAARLMHALENEVDGFCVVDGSEFRALHAETSRPLTLLGFCRADEVADMLAAAALPNVATLAELDAACEYAQAQARTVRIRAGLAPALGWNGIAPELVAAFAERAAACAFIELELWTHLTSPQIYAQELRTFDAFIATFRAANAHIASIDTASSSSLAGGADTYGGPLRIGIGLFGAYAHALPALRCALHVEADVLSRRNASAELVAGYARAQLPPGSMVEVLRIGYGDGLPRGLVGTTIHLGEGKAHIAAIGMQHMVITHDLPPATVRTLLHPDTDIVTLCTEGGSSAHELVVSLGLAHAY